MQKEQLVSVGFSHLKNHNKNMQNQHCLTKL